MHTKSGAHPVVCPKTKVVIGIFINLQLDRLGMARLLINTGALAVTGLWTFGTNTLYAESVG